MGPRVLISIVYHLLISRSRLSFHFASSFDIHEATVPEQCQPKSVWTNFPDRDDGKHGEDDTEKHHRRAKSQIKVWRRRLFTLGWIYLLMSYRKLTVTILQILIPVLVMLILVISITFHFHWELSGKAKIELTKDVQESASTGDTDTSMLRKYFIENEFICHKHGGLNPQGESIMIFTPVNPFTEEIMGRISRNLNIRNNGFGVNSEIELVEHCKWLHRNSTEGTSKTAPIGIIFKLESMEGGRNPSYEEYFNHTLSYTIRTFLKEIANTRELFPYYRAFKKEQNLSLYIGSGFLGLQNAIEFGYMDMIVQNRIKNGQPAADTDRMRGTVDQTMRPFNYQMFPFSVYLDTKARVSTWFLLVLAFFLGTFFCAFTNSKKIIEDKELGILEIFKLHGLSTSMIWTAALLQDFLFRLIQTGLLTLILLSSLTNVAFLQYQNPALLWFVLYIHGFAQASFLHLLSLLFSRATFGALMATFAGILTWLLPMTLYAMGFNFGKVFNTALCFLFPNWCLANALYNFLKFESYDRGINLELMARFADERRIIIPEGACVVLLILTTIVYFLLTVYVDNVQTKKFIPQQDPLFWLKINKQVEEIETDADNDDDFPKPPIYEMSSRTVSITCRNVSHACKGSNKVLDDVNLNIYEGEVTLLLGTTTLETSTLLRCLVGLLKPTNGYAMLYGTPISMEMIQQHVGYSPQFHSFYNYLTVEEHIQVCCLFHGNEFMVTKRQCVALMLRLNLYPIRKRSPKNLSEAQKRKLSIAMALANNPKVLILDQPTSSMDYSEAHEIWNILRGLRKRRTIITTGRNMDEGYSYAERIGILVNGRLLSFCSPSFLTATLKAGSFVRLKKVENNEVDVPGVIATMQGAVGQKVPPVTHVLMKSFEHNNTHAYFSLPPKAKVSHVLEALEAKQEELGFMKVGIMHLTLAGILQELTDRKGIEQQIIGAFVPQNMANDYQSIKMPGEIPTLPRGILISQNYVTTAKALFVKHFHYVRQKVHFLSVGILCPLLMAFILIHLCQFYLWPVPTDQALPLSTFTYPLPNIPVFLDPIGGVDATKFRKGVLSAMEKRPDRLVLFGDEPGDWDKFQRALKPAEASMVDYRAQVVMALSIEKADNRALYASNALHSAPASHNFLTNVVLFSFTDDYRLDTNPFRLLAYNHPFLDEDSEAGDAGVDVTNAAIGCILSLLLALLAGSRIGLPLLGRVTGWQNVQTVSGVTPFQHWGVMIACDVFVNIILSTLLMGSICLADKSSKGVFQGVNSKFTLFSIIATYLCCSSLPYGYILSKYMVNHFSGYGQYIIIHILFGILPKLSTYIIMYNMPRSLRGVIEGLLSLMPPYTMTGALIQYMRTVVDGSYCQSTPLETKQLCEIFDKLPQTNNLLSLMSSDPYFKSCCVKYCKSAGTCYKRTPFPGVQSTLLIMLGQGIFYFIVLLVIEYKVMSRVLAVIQRNSRGNVEAARLHLLREVEANTSNEASVQKEVERIEELAESGLHFAMTDLIYSRNITKSDGKREVLSHVYFGVPPASVLGIAGFIGSGKSILAKIIVGDIEADGGYCVIRPGVTLASSRKNYLKRIGYCPEENALLPFLTGFQMMQLMGRIRGLPPKYLDIHCRKWLELFRFRDKEMETVTGNYENEMKRRLCCAMALLGNPDIVVFDEPTTCLDVISHQNFWSIIQMVRQRGQSVIFTSISAQECIENSTNMILLENGTMKAFGNPETINKQYVPGWTIVVRLRADLNAKLSKRAIENKRSLLKDSIEGMYSPCDLMNDDDNLLTYHMKEQSKPLSEMYAVMEAMHLGMPDFISDYIIEETSLDDIMGYFGGSRNRQMRLASFGSDDDNSSGEDANTLAGMDFSDLSDETRLKWKAARRRRSSAHHAPVKNVLDVLRKSLSAKRTIDKVRERRQKLTSGGSHKHGSRLSNAGGMPPSIFSPQHSDAVKYLQRRAENSHLTVSSNVL